MRLIDEKTILEYASWVFIDEDIVKEMPTVEAIPVDWLREHRKQTRYKRSARIIEQLVRLYQEEQER